MTRFFDWNARIDIPESWFALPLDMPDEPASQDIESQVQARIKRNPSLADYSRNLVGLLSMYTDEYRADSALAALVRWDTSALDSFTVATVVAHVYERSHPSSLSSEIERLTRLATEPLSTDRNDREVEARHIRAGPAVRVEFLSAVQADGRADDEGHLVVETVQYFVPIPEHADLLQLAFTTPNLAAAEDLIAEFDAMAERMRLELPGSHR